MVDTRRQLNKELQSLDEATLDWHDVNDPQNGPREPKCQRCKHHGESHPLKNHKRVCKYKNCGCDKCALVTNRRLLMVKQIKLRRSQKKEREVKTLPNLMDGHMPPHFPPAPWMQQHASNIKMQAAAQHHAAEIQTASTSTSSLCCLPKFWMPKPKWMKQHQQKQQHEQQKKKERALKTRMQQAASVPLFLSAGEQAQQQEQELLRVQAAVVELRLRDHRNAD